jgi:hypothetical protein
MKESFVGYSNLKDMIKEYIERYGVLKGMADIAMCINCISVELNLQESKDETSKKGGEQNEC